MVPTLSLPLLSRQDNVRRNCVSSCDSLSKLSRNRAPLLVFAFTLFPSLFPIAAISVLSSRWGAGATTGIAPTQWAGDRASERLDSFTEWGREAPGAVSGNAVQCGQCNRNVAETTFLRRCFDLNLASCGRTDVISTRLRRRNVVTPER